MNIEDIGEYRAKRIDNGEWIEGYLYIEKSTSMCLEEYGCSPLINYYIITIENNRRTFIEIDKNTIGQYTGRKDKNGTKIFGRDSIKIKLRNGRIQYAQVDYSNYYAQFILICDDVYLSDEPLGDYDDIEVVDNKELLEE